MSRFFVGYPIEQIWVDYNLYNAYQRLSFAQFGNPSTAPRCSLHSSEQFSSFCSCHWINEFTGAWTPICFWGTCITTLGYSLQILIWSLHRMLLNFDIVLLMINATSDYNATDNCMICSVAFHKGKQNPVYPLVMIMYCPLHHRVPSTSRLSRHTHQNIIWCNLQHRWDYFQEGETAHCIRLRLFFA